VSIHAVIDTNVLIAAMRSRLGASHAILLAIHDRRVTPVLSVPLLMEYEEVARRPDVLPHLRPEQIDAILNQVCDRALEQKIHFNWRPRLPDPDDDMLLELAVASRADYIVTNNVRDLAPATDYGIQVLEPRDFARILSSE